MNSCSQVPKSVVGAYLRIYRKYRAYCQDCFFYPEPCEESYLQYKKSHGTDWVFVIMLFIIVLTEISQHIFHRTGLPQAGEYNLRIPFNECCSMVAQDAIQQMGTPLHPTSAMFFTEDTQKA